MDKSSVIVKNKGLRLKTELTTWELGHLHMRFVFLMMDPSVVSKITLKVNVSLPNAKSGLCQKEVV